MTLCAGIWPPSPGFDPWAILIWSSSANAAYSAVTPKRPDATCLIFELRSSRYRVRVLPALPGVRAPAEAVERDRDRLVRLRGERAVRHRAAREPAHDRLHRLDLVERQRLGRGDELEKVARLDRRPLVDERGEALVEVVPLALHGLHERVRRGDAVGERRDDVRVGAVRLAALAELVEARVLELRLLGDARGEPAERVPLEPVEPDPADRGRRSAEEALAETPVEADRLEQPCAPVAGDVGDPHLRHDLQDAVLERAQETRLGLGGRRTVAPDLVGVGEPGDGLERETRADDVGAVADERRDHVRVPRLVGRHEERARGAEARARRAARGPRRRRGARGSARDRRPRRRR